MASYLHSKLSSHAVFSHLTWALKSFLKRQFSSYGMSSVRSQRFFLCEEQMCLCQWAACDQLSHCVHVYVKQNTWTCTMYACCFDLYHVVEYAIGGMKTGIGLTIWSCLVAFCKRCIQHKHRPFALSWVMEELHTFTAGFFVATNMVFEMLLGWVVDCTDVTKPVSNVWSLSPWVDVYTVCQMYANHSVIQCASSTTTKESLHLSSTLTNRALHGCFTTVSWDMHWTLTTIQI